VHLTFEGTRITGLAGDTVSAALVDAGEYACREAADGSVRGVFCGMGVCQECLVVVDGRPGQRACMTPIAEGMAITRQPVLPDLATLAATTPPVRREIACDVLVVGAGAAGMLAAAHAAEAGLDVVLADERPKLGGQFYKQPAGPVDEPALDPQYRAGRALIDRLERSGATILSQTTVWGAFGPHELTAYAPGESLVLRPRRLVLATGAYERGVPVPGWTLPGVMTTGAAQTLLRAYQVIPGARVLVAGNGPLNMQVAAEIVRAGGTIVALAELAPRPVPARLGAATRMLALAPDLIRDGLGYQATLRRVPTRYGTALVRAEGARTVERATIARIGGDGRAVAGTEETFEVDAVCMGYGFLSSSELSRAAGCRHAFDERQGQLIVVHDGRGRTSVDDVWSIGDGAGVAGARVARARGTLAAADVVRSLGGTPSAALLREERSATKAHSKAARFQEALWSLYRGPRLDPGDDDTLVCRCENVPRRAIEAAVAERIEHVGAIKRATRAGMGGCQGRYCGVVAAGISGRQLGEYSLFAPGAPIRPARIGDL
jgi:NADPH-dependent 2,4-dienoyl-CoA reductase/sulfur reductase-like enzyme